MSNVKGRIRQLLWRTSPKLYGHLVRKQPGQRFAIGIFAGQSPCRLQAPEGVSNPVLTSADVVDTPALFVADPFMIRDGKGYRMFFEVMSDAYRRGLIATARSENGWRWRYEGIVLHEDFHLAYPYVFQWQGETYMVPDTPSQGVRLYRADPFPHRWTFVKQLISGKAFSDSTLLEIEDRWWMFSAWTPGEAAAYSLRLYEAESPLGPWHEHPSSPVVPGDNRIGRPAGRPRVIDGQLYRFAQDCEHCYGERVHAIRVDELTADRYAESEAPSSSILEAGDEPWRSGGMHHIDAHQIAEDRWLACVDGWYWEPADGNHA